MFSFSLNSDFFFFFFFDEHNFFCIYHSILIWFYSQCGQKKRFKEPLMGISSINMLSDINLRESVLSEIFYSLEMFICCYTILNFGVWKWVVWDFLGKFWTCLTSFYRLCLTILTIHQIFVDLAGAMEKFSRKIVSDGSSLFTHSFLFHCDFKSGLVLFFFSLSLFSSSYVCKVTTQHCFQT